MNRDDYYELGRQSAAAGLDETVAEGIPLEEAMAGLAADLLAEMEEWDQSDPMYDYWVAEYQGMLSRLD